MNKLIPVITLCLSTIMLLLCAAALVLSALSCYIPPVSIIALPFPIIGLVSAAVLAPLSFLFKKDILCKISFYINIVSLVFAITAVCVGFSVL